MFWDLNLSRGKSYSPAVDLCDVLMGGRLPEDGDQTTERRSRNSEGGRGKDERA